MSAISYNHFRKDPGKVIDEVFDTDEPVTVTRSDGRDVVILSAHEFESWKETMHLLSTRKNASRLRESLRQLGAGEVVELDIPKVLFSKSA